MNVQEQIDKIGPNLGDELGLTIIMTYLIITKMPRFTV